jgi:hypothetical protein
VWAVGPAAAQPSAAAAAAAAADVCSGRGREAMQPIIINIIIIIIISISIIIAPRRCWCCYHAHSVAFGLPPQNVCGWVLFQRRCLRMEEIPEARWRRCAGGHLRRQLTAACALQAAAVTSSCLLHARAWRSSWALQQHRRCRRHCLRPAICAAADGVEQRREGNTRCWRSSSLGHSGAAQHWRSVCTHHAGALPAYTKCSGRFHRQLLSLLLRAQASHLMRYDCIIIISCKSMQVLCRAAAAVLLGSEWHGRGSQVASASRRWRGIMRGARFRDRGCAQTAHGTLCLLALFHACRCLLPYLRLRRLPLLLYTGGSPFSVPSDSRGSRAGKIAAFIAAGPPPSARRLSGAHRRRLQQQCCQLHATIGR